VGGGCVLRSTFELMTFSLRPLDLRVAFRATLLAVVLFTEGHAWGLCIFNIPNNPDTVSFGTIDPSLNTTYTFTVSVNFACVLSAPTFTITGLNDTGPNAFRLKHVSQVPPQYMPYTVSTTTTATKLTLNGQLIAADYKNAFGGSYTDTLTIMLTP
jgi:hypothetical protein